MHSKASSYYTTTAARKCSWYFAVTAMLLLFCSPVILHAQDTAHQLKEVNVKAIQLPAITRLALPAQQLNKEELNTINSISVADAVKYFSGVLVKDYGGIGGLKTISVRSLGANHTGILYDGFMLSDIQGGQIDLGKFSLDNINSITLYNGQPADKICLPARLYSAASVLALTTALPSFDHTRFHAAASVKTGSFGLINPAATVHYQWTKRWVSSLSAEWQKANGAYPFTLVNGDSVSRMKRNNTDVQSLRLEMDQHLLFKDSSLLKVKGYYYHSERGLPGAVVLYNNNASQRLWDKLFFVQTNWQKQWKKSELLISGRYNYSANRYLDPEFLNAAGKQENHYSQQEAYLSGAYALQVLPALRLSYATDAWVNTMQADVAGFVKPKRYSLLNALTGKFTLHRVEMQATLLATYVKDITQYAASPGSKNELMPAVAISYQPLRNIPVSVRVFYKNIFRMPTFNDLYYTNVGNSLLKPEYARQYNAGITWQQNLQGKIISAVALTADAYYNRVKDKIVAVPRQNLFLWTMLNFGRADVHGIDATLQLYFKEIKQVQFSFKGNYIYQQAKDLSDPASATYKDQLPYTPVHSGAVNAGIAYKKFQFNYNVLFSGSRYRLGENIPYNKLNSWVTQDVSLAYHFTIQQQQWRLLLEVNNLFGTPYDIIKYYPMPGRNIRLGATFKI